MNDVPGRDDDGLRDGDEPERDPAEELRDALREMLSGGAGFDPSKLAGVGGLPSDPALVSALVEQMRQALGRQGGDGGIDWRAATEHAKAVAGSGHREVTPEERSRYEHAFRLAELWLGEATSVGELLETPRTMTRREWVAGSMPAWSALTEPVAESIASALTSVLAEQIPPEMAGMLGDSANLFRNVGGAMFGLQLGQVVGRLACEVVSGGDIGMPVLADRRATLIPQNVDAFGEGLDVDSSQVELYLAVREIAHARLFQHAKWLQLHLTSQVTEFAQGITIDVSAIEDLAASIDPQNPDEIRSALERGAFIPPRTEQQDQALARIETMLALVEGWVDAVTHDATARLPKGEALGESMRRRRATGGPAEKAFGSLVGLELRPRRLREAAAMWRRIADELGPAMRDALWDHFDAVPTAEDIDDPSALIARLRGETAGEPDAMDAALASLLENPDAFGEAPEGGVVRDAADRRASGDPSDPRDAGAGGREQGSGEQGSGEQEGESDGEDGGSSDDDGPAPSTGHDAPPV
ncbi:hypothetical protein USB125703_01461 [Pseudoclavibacter triregionum]|nr:hypothetical protein USB125703_01461 [Pseudoclavibacter triregionum]